MGRCGLPNRRRRRARDLPFYKPGLKGTHMETGQQDKKEGWERELLEKLAFASLEESRKARRWGMFFKIFIAVYLVVLLLLMQSGTWGEKALVGRYTALVALDGEISADSNASADRVVSGLREAFADKAAVGVILHANSPGGSPVQPAYIYKEILRLRTNYPEKSRS